MGRVAVIVELFKFSTLRGVLGLPLHHVECKMLWYDILARFGVDETDRRSVSQLSAGLNAVAESLDSGCHLEYNRFLELTERALMPSFCEVSGA